jgi:hypothetical protein
VSVVVSVVRCLSASHGSWYLANAAGGQAPMAELEERASSDSTLASYIVEALGEIGNPEAIPMIERAMRPLPCWVPACGYNMAQENQEQSWPIKHH